MAIRELDRKVAQQVFGHEVTEEGDGRLLEHCSDGRFYPLRAYSSDIAAAWEIVDKIGITLIPIEDGSWFGLVSSGYGWKTPADFIQYLQDSNFADAGAAVAPNAPRAICLAALRAMENRPELKLPFVEINPTLPH